MANLEFISHDSMVGIVISFVASVLAALGWFVKRWVDKVENDIKARVVQQICEKEHEKQNERRMTDKARIEEFVAELRLLGKRFDDHLDDHCGK